MPEYRSRILGVGAYVPPRVVTNHDLAKVMETTHEWIVERSGIEERHWVDPGEAGAEMAAKACTEALEKGGLAAKDVDMIIYATLSPDVTFPGTGVFVQRLLGIRDIPCYDIRQQCTGFIYGLAMADAFIRTGQYKHILVIGSEVHSTGLDVSTRGRDVTVLFGDGAGAALLGRATDDSHQLLSTHIHADGADAEILWTESPASRAHPRITEEDMAAGKHYPRMEGKKVFKHAVTRMPMVLMEGMVANGLKLDDIDMVIPHQANSRIIEALRKRLDLPPERMYSNIERFGNTSSASVPIALDEARRSGQVKQGSLILSVAFGGGLVWGAALYRL
jgi:3-oxoacyl-[acyl-carrier-protein] synthase-3